MIHQWKGLHLEITYFEYHLDLTYKGGIMPSETLNLKHVQIIKVSDKPTYDTSFGRS